MSIKQIWLLLKQTFQEWNEDKASRLAAALSYYTIFSLSPLLIIVIAIAGAFFGRDAARSAMLEQMQSLVGTSGADVVAAALENTQSSQGANIIASLVSVAILLFGASGVFIQLQDSLNTVWNVVAKPDNAATGFIRKRILSFSMVLALGFLLIVSLTVSTVLAALSQMLSTALPGLDSLWQLLNFVVSLTVLTFMFAVLYKYVPDVKISWKDVWIGGLLTSILFTLGKSLIGLYLGNSGFASTYGAASSIVIVLAWIYYSAQILFFGAEFTQVYAKRYGSRIVPDDHAVSLTEEARVRQGIPHRSTIDQALRRQKRDRP